MASIPANGMKLMRIIHVIASQIWFGAVVCIFGLAVICFNNMEAGRFVALAPIIPQLYKAVVLPAAMVCIVQGLIYGAFSKWGFMKFKWVLAKWIMVILVVLCTGMGGIGQVFAILDYVQSNNIQTIAFNEGKLLFAFIGCQLVLLCAMTVLSIMKPKQKHKL